MVVRGGMDDGETSNIVSGSPDKYRDECYLHAIINADSSPVRICDVVVISVRRDVNEGSESWDGLIELAGSGECGSCLWEGGIEVERGEGGRL
jgi:hypothetical protein